MRNVPNFRFLCLSWIKAKFFQWNILENTATYVGKIHSPPTVFTKEPLQNQAEEIAQSHYDSRKKQRLMLVGTIIPQSNEKLISNYFRQTYKILTLN